MSKYAKPRQLRTERRGERPSDLPLPDGVSPKDLERAGERLLRILVNSHIPTKEEAALMKQARLLCNRLKAFKEGNPIRLNQLTLDLRRHEDTIRSSGCYSGKIIHQNLWISRVVVNDEKRFNELLQQLEGKNGDGRS